MNLINGYLANPNHPITVTVVGCGGTGSRLIPRLAQMNFAIKHFNNHPGFHLTAYDDDIVEYNNVGRQNFYESDIGDYKSINIIEKCNAAYGTIWDAKVEKFRDMPKTNIIISCVDNGDFRIKMSKSRAEILKTYSSRNNYEKCMYWIDCGNGKDFGQVVIADLYQSILKDVVQLFPQYENQDNSETQGFEGCASYAEKLEDQDLFINDELAFEAGKLFWMLLRNREISIQGTIINAREFKKLPLKI